MKDKILLFIPMYNCEKQILRVLDQLHGDIAALIDEVIIVNNRSTDNGEAAVIQELQDNPLSMPTLLLRNEENYGLGGSHKVAFQYAIKHQFDYVVVLHGDDQGDISNLLPLLISGTFQKYDCCLGARFLKGAKLVGYSKFRTFGNQIFNIIFSIAVGKRIYDLGAGLNLYSTKMLKSKFYETFPDNLTFNCYMLFALSAYGQTHYFFPIIWREEDQVSNVKMTKQAWQTFKIACGFFFRRQKFLNHDARAQKIGVYTANIIYRGGERG